MSATHILVLVTTKNLEEAETITEKLLEEKLIVCTNIINPVISHFHWQGKNNKSEECLMLIKSRMDQLPKMIELIKKLHSYQVPEILVLPIVSGSSDYLAWIDEALEKPHVQKRTRKP
jgi:periplasmic divalent cation tolerance protein